MLTYGRGRDSEVALKRSRLEKLSNPLEHQLICRKHARQGRTYMIGTAEALRLRGEAMGVGAVGVLVVVFGALAFGSWQVVRSRARSRKLDEWLAGRLDAAVQAHWHEADLNLAIIANPYQYARRGTKANIQWYCTDVWQDTWFQDLWPKPGSLVLLSGSSGYGPHNTNPNVFYVRRVHEFLPPETHFAWHRHQQRLSKARG